MAKTIEEFKDELRALREEMYQNSEKADLKLIASYLDRLVMPLEGLTETLQSMDTEVETLSEAEAESAGIGKKELGDFCSCECCEAPKAKKKSKPAKKPAKKAKKKRK